MQLIAFLFAILALAGAQPALAQDFPARPDGPLLDAASIIPPEEEAALDAQLREYNARTGRAIIVATVNSLDGQPVDVYAQQLAEEWDIGGAETEEGALMLVAPNERDVWISTARGTQVRLTDITIGRIISQAIIPAFKQGDYAAGISAGINAMIERLDMDPAQAEAIAEAEAVAAASERSGRSGATIGGAIFWVVMILAFMFLFGRGGGGRRRRYGAGSSVGNIILWSALGSAMGGSRGHDSGFGGGGFGGGGGGFGGFGGGGGGFNGGGAGGSW